MRLVYKDKPCVTVVDDVIVRPSGLEFDQDWLKYRMNKTA